MAVGGGTCAIATYSRHCPEQTLLYQLVEQHYPAFVELMAGADRPLPAYIREEFDAYLRCGRLEQGFLRVCCEDCYAERLGASCKRRGFCPSCRARRMTEAAALLEDVESDVPTNVLRLARAIRPWDGADCPQERNHMDSPPR